MSPAHVSSVQLLSSYPMLLPPIDSLHELRWTGIQRLLISEIRRSGEQQKASISTRQVFYIDD